MIELMIKIPEDEYQKVLLTGKAGFRIVNAIEASTPLPKGHGRLIDADALDRDLENAQVNLDDTLSEAFDDGLTWASEVASKLPTIIEADKAEKADGGRL